MKHALRTHLSVLYLFRSMFGNWRLSATTISQSWSKAPIATCISKLFPLENLPFYLPMTARHGAQVRVPRQIWDYKYFMPQNVSHLPIKAYAYVKIAVASGKKKDCTLKLNKIFQFVRSLGISQAKWNFSDWYRRRAPCSVVTPLLLFGQLRGLGFQLLKTNE